MVFFREGFGNVLITLYNASFTFLLDGHGYDAAPYDYYDDDDDDNDSDDE